MSQPQINQFIYAGGEGICTYNSTMLSSTLNKNEAASVEFQPAHGTSTSDMVSLSKTQMSLFVDAYNVYPHFSDPPELGVDYEYFLTRKEMNRVVHALNGNTDRSINSKHVLFEYGDLDSFVLNKLSVTEEYLHRTSYYNNRLRLSPPQFSQLNDELRLHAETIVTAHNTSLVSSGVYYDDGDRKWMVTSLPAVELYTLYIMMMYLDNNMYKLVNFGVGKSLMFQAGGCVYVPSTDLHLVQPGWLFISPVFMWIKNKNTLGLMPMYITINTSQQIMKYLMGLDKYRSFIGVTGPYSRVRGYGVLDAPQVVIRTVVDLAAITSSQITPIDANVLIDANVNTVTQFNQATAFGLWFQTDFLVTENKVYKMRLAQSFSLPFNDIGSVKASVCFANAYVYPDSYGTFPSMFYVNGGLTSNHIEIEHNPSGGIASWSSGEIYFVADTNAITVIYENTPMSRMMTTIVEIDSLPISSTKMLLSGSIVTLPENNQPTWVSYQKPVSNNETPVFTNDHLINSSEFEKPPIITTVKQHKKDRLMMYRNNNGGIEYCTAADAYTRRLDCIDILCVNEYSIDGVPTLTPEQLLSIKYRRPLREYPEDIAPFLLSGFKSWCATFKVSSLPRAPYYDSCVEITAYDEVSDSARRDIMIWGSKMEGYISKNVNNCHKKVISLLWNRMMHSLNGNTEYSHKVTPLVYKPKIVEKDELGYGYLLNNMSEKKPNVERVSPESNPIRRDIHQKNLDHLRAMLEKEQEVENNEPWVPDPNFFSDQSQMQSSKDDEILPMTDKLPESSEVSDFLNSIPTDDVPKPVKANVRVNSESNVESKALTNVSALFKEIEIVDEKIEKKENTENFGMELVDNKGECEKVTLETLIRFLERDLPQIRHCMPDDMYVDCFLEGVSGLPDFEALEAIVGVKVRALNSSVSMEFANSVDEGDLPSIPGERDVVLSKEFYRSTQDDRINSGTKGNVRNPNNRLGGGKPKPTNSEVATFARKQIAFGKTLSGWHDLVKLMLESKLPSGFLKGVFGYLEFEKKGLYYTFASMYASGCSYADFIWTYIDKHSMDNVWLEDAWGSQVFECWAMSTDIKTVKCMEDVSRFVKDNFSDIKVLLTEQEARNRLMHSLFGNTTFCRDLNEVRQLPTCEMLCKGVNKGEAPMDLLPLLSRMGLINVDYVGTGGTMTDSRGFVARIIAQDNTYTANVSLKPQEISNTSRQVLSDAGALLDAGTRLCVVGTSYHVESGVPILPSPFFSDLEARISVKGISVQIMNASSVGGFMNADIFSVGVDKSVNNLNVESGYMKLMGYHLILGNAVAGSHSIMNQNQIERNLYTGISSPFPVVNTYPPIFPPINVFNEECLTGAGNPMFPMEGNPGALGTISFHVSLNSVPQHERGNVIAVPKALSFGFMDANIVIFLVAMMHSPWPFGFMGQSVQVTVPVIAAVRFLYFNDHHTQVRIPGRLNLHILLSRQVSGPPPTDQQSSNLMCDVAVRSGATGFPNLAANTPMNVSFVGVGGLTAYSLCSYLRSWALHVDSTDTMVMMKNLNLIVGANDLWMSCFSKWAYLTTQYQPCIMLAPGELDIGNVDDLTFYTRTFSDGRALVRTTLDFPIAPQFPVVELFLGELHPRAWSKVMMDSHYIGMEVDFDPIDKLFLLPQLRYAELLVGRFFAMTFDTFYRQFSITTQIFNDAFNQNYLTSYTSLIRKLFVYQGHQMTVFMKAEMGGVLNNIFSCLSGWKLKTFPGVYDVLSSRSSTGLGLMQLGYLDDDLTPIDTCVVQTVIDIFFQITVVPGFCPLYRAPMPNSRYKEALGALWMENWSMNPLGPTGDFKTAYMPDNVLKPILKQSDLFSVHDYYLWSERLIWIMNDQNNFGFTGVRTRIYGGAVIYGNISGKIAYGRDYTTIGDPAPFVGYFPCSGIAGFLPNITRNGARVFASFSTATNLGVSLMRELSNFSTGTVTIWAVGDYKVGPQLYFTPTHTDESIQIAKWGSTRGNEDVPDMPSN